MSTTPTPKTVSERLRVHILGMAPHQKDREQGQLLMDAAGHILHLERELAVLRAGFGLREDERVVLDQKTEHGAILVDDKQATRKRVSPCTDEEVRLERELAEARARTSPKTLDELEAVNLRSIVSDQDEDIAVLRAENERRREIMAVWVDHLEGCPIRYDGSGDCNCGLSEALTKEEPK